MLWEWWVVASNCSLSKPLVNQFQWWLWDMQRAVPMYHVLSCPAVVFNCLVVTLGGCICGIAIGNGVKVIGEDPRIQVLD